MNENQYLEKSVMRGWQFLTGDINFSEYGGKWYRKINDILYHVIDLCNMYDATGEESGEKYVVSLQEINLITANILGALACCGWDSENQCQSSGYSMNNLPVEILVDSVSSYGSYAPMGEWTGNNYTKLLKSAKKESSDIDPRNGYNIYRAMQLVRPVNQLGSTAAEFGAGDFQSALIRGLARKDPASKIIGKMYGLSAEDIESVDAELSDYTAHPVSIESGE